MELVEYKTARVSDEDVETSKASVKGYEVLAQSMKTPKKSQDISWSQVNFTANGAKILTDCWGHVPGGKTCAIMGPSGAGKSSLLNVLAGRSAPAPGIDISGKFSVGGTPINPVAFRSKIAYVMQEDALLATATPREALTFSAKLRLPSDISSETITTIVNALLDELGLTDCADIMIGGPLIKGISGGQKKRTSVGVEIVTNPSLLFLDEPTSGLDSYSAYNCINLLKKVAEQSNATILCTIHQPSSEVFFLFDLIIFMKNGRILYQGPVDETTSYFSKLGYECPANYNPSDYVMFISQSESLEMLENKQVFMKCDPKFMSDSQVEHLKSEIVLESKASTWIQLQWLLYRELLNTQRDIGALIGRFGVTIFLNLLYGLIFFNAAGKNDSDPTNFNSHFGAMSMIAISSMFGAAQPVMLLFPFERPMFLREYSTGTYSAVAYFFSKVCVELPLTFLQVIFAYLLVYFLVNMQGSFIQLVGAAWALGIASSSVAVILGCAIPDVKNVTELAPLLFVPQLLFAGFFVRTSQIPIFLRWSQYLCSLKYAMNLIILIEFDPTLPSCSGGAQPLCEGLMTANNVVRSQYWLYILLLGALFVVFRIFGGMILVHKAKRFY